MSGYLNVVQIIVCVALIIVVLLQAKGAGFSGAMSTDFSIYSTRRGVERTLFNVTIALAVLFVLVSIVSVLAARGQGSSVTPVS